MLRAPSSSASGSQDCARAGGGNGPKGIQVVSSNSGACFAQAERLSCAGGATCQRRKEVMAALCSGLVQVGRNCCSCCSLHSGVQRTSGLSPLCRHKAVSMVQREELQSQTVHIKKQVAVNWSIDYKWLMSEQNNCDWNICHKCKCSHFFALEQGLFLHAF